VSAIRPAEVADLRTQHPYLRLIDVRTPGEFASRHIAGSYNVPLPVLGEHQAELRERGAEPVVLICQSGRRATAAEAQLRQAGFESIRVLDGGMLAWEAAGLPTSAIQADNLPWTIERQVRLVAGLLVAVSIAASVIWPPARFLAGAVGLGLVFAAVTNTCTMGALLARLPYNRRAVSCDLPTVVSALTGPTSEVKS
jgi:rhodanese-related sulfurtransferase